MSLSISVYLVDVRCWCGLPFAVPQETYDYYCRANDNKPQSHSLYCPLGHAMTQGASNRLKELQDELARERHRLDQTRAERDDALLKAARSERKLKRVANGVCPECKRSFANLARHMQCKHGAKAPATEPTLPSDPMSRNEEICALHHGGMSLPALAEKFRLSRQRIYQIVRASAPGAHP